MKNPPRRQFSWLVLVAVLVASCVTQQVPAPTPAPPAGATPDSSVAFAESAATGALPATTHTEGASEPGVRPAEFAGTWYPGDPEELRGTVDSLLGAARVKDGAPIAMIVPHAGYAYSGAVAATGFAQLRNGEYDTAVIIGTDHQVPISNPIAVWPDGAFETPLGRVPIDSDLAGMLVAADPRIRADRAAHEGEHSIEIQLPFLQEVCPHCSIVPILMGGDDEDTVSALADALVKALPGRKAVVIASSDLSHYPSYADAVAIDGATLDAVETGDPQLVRAAIAKSMSTGNSQLLTCACGEAAILVAMEVARRLGADTTTILRYANSGDTPGADKNQVVGYGAIMLWRYLQPELTSQEQESLLWLARDAIAGELSAKPSSPAHSADPALERKAGAFVTLNLNGELRGCIGHMSADQPLRTIIPEMARAAAFSDPRFPSLSSDELDRVRIEISVLSPIHRITDTQRIRLGTDGLMLDSGGAQGVFLPQVPVQEGWDLGAYLQNLCSKAGLLRGCWSEAALYTFTAEVFGEDER